MSRSFEEIAAAYRAALPNEGLSLLRIEGLDRTGIPVTQANLVVPGKPVTTGHGYGLSADEANVGALGELCEEALCGAHCARAEHVVGCYAALVRSRGVRGVIDPLTLCLEAGTSYDADRELTWFEARRHPSGEPVLVPADWIAAHGYQLGHAPELITPITNGLGAGLDLAHAIGHGVMELLQRDGNVVGYRALDQGIVVELDRVGDTQVLALLERLRSSGIDVKVKLASTEWGMGNLYVVGDDLGAPTTSLQVTACGEAAHPDRERALRKALLEFCGSRARKAATHGPIDQLRAVMGDVPVARLITAARPDDEEPRALAAMVEWLGQDAPSLRARLAATVFSERHIVRLSDLPTADAQTSADPVARLQTLTDMLSAGGLGIVYVDCSPPGGEVRAVKVVVPGLEAEIMSYGRIGWRGVRRLRDRDDPLIVGRARDGARRVLMRPEDEERAGGPAWFDAALAERIVGPLYPLYREPGCFSAQLRRTPVECP